MRCPYCGRDDTQVKDLTPLSKMKKMEKLSIKNTLVTDVITHRFALEETERALTISRTDRNSLKAMVHTAHRTQARATA